MKQIPLSNISITATENHMVRDALASGWVSGSGRYVNLFESTMAQICERKFAIATANGTLALEALVRAMISPGAAVVVPALTFVSPAAAVLSFGATPVFVDVDPVSWCLSPLKVAEAIELFDRDIEAMIAVDLLGHPAEYTTLKKFGLPIIEDAAEAHGAAGQDNGGFSPCGSFGEASIFSFHANKTISSGEGGIVLTNNEELAKKVRLIVNHGMTSQYHHDIVGSNYRMTNLTAALGYAQVTRWVELVQGRNSIRAMYESYMPKGVQFRPVADYAYPSTWMVCILHPERDAALKRLRENGVDARAIFKPIPSLPPYFEPDWQERYPVAAAIASQAMFLPTFHDLTITEVKQVCDLLR